MRIRRIIAAAFTVTALGAAPFAITASSAPPQAGGVEQLAQHGGVLAGGPEQLSTR